MYNNNNRRSNTDRRLSKSNVTFPLRTHDNVVITQDRRVRCERRIEGLEVNESNLSQEAFMSMFNTLLCKSDPSGLLDTAGAENQTADAFNGYFNHE